MLSFLQILLLVFTVPILATPLEFPPYERSLETVNENISSLWVSEGEDAKIFYLPANAMYFVEVPKNPGEAFHDFTKSKRHPFDGPTLEIQGQFNGVIMTTSNELEFLSGRRLSFSLVGKNFSHLAQGGLVWDEIKPAKDSRGEPSKEETADCRSDFSKLIESQEGTKISGFAKAPMSWSDDTMSNGAVTYEFILASTQIPRFPLINLICDMSSSFQCWVKRQCFLEGMSFSDPKKIRGIAVLPQKKWILIGEERQIHIFRFESCLHVPKLASFELPPKLKNLVGLYIGADESLWVSTEKKDDYHNASVFFWPAKEWQPTL